MDAKGAEIAPQATRPWHPPPHNANTDRSASLTRLISKLQAHFSLRQLTPSLPLTLNIVRKLSSDY